MCIKYFYNRLRFIVVIDKVVGGGNFFLDTVYIPTINVLLHFSHDDSKRHNTIIQHRSPSNLDVNADVFTTAYTSMSSHLLINLQASVTHH